MRNYYLIFLPAFLLVLGCDTKSSMDKGKELLQQTITASGGEYFNNSIIRFTNSDIQYTLERRNNILNFTMVRIVDSVTYKATYNNGATAYYINDELQPESFYSRKFIDSKLDGFSYLMGIPHVFDQNSVLVDQEEDVTIGKQSYHCLHVWFKTIIDDPENEFYLYINPETKLVDFFTEKYDLNGESILLKKAFNQRSIEGISFADYKVFRSRDSDSLTLDKIYTKYNDRTIEYVNDLIFENIEVELLEKQK